MNLKKLQDLAADLEVLYVEDDAAIQKTMKKYLQIFFTKVRSASDGEEGLQYFKESTFDLVITDLSMPKMNGSDMIKEIRKLDMKMPILITTAHVDSKYLIDAIKSHVDGYIIKPFDYSLLNAELFKVVEKIQKFKENNLYKNHLEELLAQQSHQIEENYSKTIYSIVELIEERDTYTAGHSKRVAHYSTLIAKQMNYSEKEITLLHKAALLHDIGKIETPDAVLLNPKKLSEIEYTLIQEHVTVGYNFLNRIPMFSSLAEIVHEHHEHYDGTGYPNGLIGEEIHPLARILILCDAFDAMTTSRIYKGRKTIAEALEEISKLSEKQFDSVVVQAALIVLKDITLEDNINQLPKTKLEEERFAYFYRDSLSEIYNQNYLDVVLSKNIYSKELDYMKLFLIHDFTTYNEKNGWKNGDNILKMFARILETHFPEAFAFRVFGDDFVLLSKEELDTKGMQIVLDKLVQENQLTYSVKNINLKIEKIEKLADLTSLKH